MKRRYTQEEKENAVALVAMLLKQDGMSLSRACLAVAETLEEVTGRTIQSWCYVIAKMKGDEKRQLAMFKSKGAQEPEHEPEPEPELSPLPKFKFVNDEEDPEKAISIAFSGMSFGSQGRWPD